MFSLRAASRSLTRTTLSRSFAKNAAKGGSADVNPLDELMHDKDKHEPLLQLYGSEGRFASATYRQASRAGQLEDVQKNLQVMQDLVKNSPDVAFFLSNPTVGESELKDAVATIVKEGKFSSVTRSLMDVLVESNKLKDVHKIGKAYDELMMARNGEVPALVTSAEELSKGDLKAVEGALQARLGKGQKLLLKTQVDPTIVGGLVVELGNEMADLSARSSLTKMELTLSSK
jgi:ATP synthase F1 delta subunit